MELNVPGEVLLAPMITQSFRTSPDYSRHGVKEVVSVD